MLDTCQLNRLVMGPEWVLKGAACVGFGALGVGVDKIASHRGVGTSWLGHTDLSLCGPMVIHDSQSCVLPQQLSFSFINNLGRAAQLTCRLTGKELGCNLYNFA